MFDPEGNDLYEGYEDEDVGMEKGPDIVPGYHKVDDENNMYNSQWTLYFVLVCFS